jgi:hypothetical protein
MTAAIAESLGTPTTLTDTAPTVVVPAGLDAGWVDAIRAAGFEVLTDSRTDPVPLDRLDTAAAVVTAARVAIADTGTIVLDGAEDQGRRAITLVPDHHICVVRADQIVGIGTRKNLLRAVADLAREVPDPTADDDKVRDRIVAAIEANDWRPFGLSVMVRDGVVHLNGVITEERSRQAAIVAAENVCGVKEVHDHLCWVDTMSGFYLNSPEDDRAAKKAS